MNVRARHSEAVGLTKFQLYKKTYARIDRAISSGFHIEAVALLESIICDRLESLLTVLTEEPVNASTIGKLLDKLKKFNAISPALEVELRRWNKERGLVIHQFVKITTNTETSWNSRLRYARDTALHGKEVLRSLRKETDRLIRTSHKRNV